MLGPTETSASFFDSQPFLAALGRALAPREPSEVVEVEVDGLLYRVLAVGGRVVPSAPFLDFHRPVGVRGERPARPCRFDIPRAVRAVPTADAWLQGWWAAGPNLQPAPLTDWTRYPDWDAFERAVRTRKSNWVRDGRRRRRKLEREVGRVTFSFHDPDPGLLDLAMGWKSAQYRRTGHRDQFSRPVNVALFRDLQAEGLLEVSALRAEGRPVAVHLGATWQGRFHYWVPAFDEEMAVYSPGRLLLDDLLEASHRRGDLAFDFLLGDEDYKYLFATHVQVVAPVGPHALHRRVGQASGRRARAWLGAFEPLRTLARAVSSG